jgi:hypothetical protein
LVQLCDGSVACVRDATAPKRQRANIEVHAPSPLFSGRRTRADAIDAPDNESPARGEVRFARMIL